MRDAVITIVIGTVREQATLSGPVTTIGRVGCDLTLNDPKVSKTHARITSRAGVYEIEDANSRNGVYVNGTKIDKAVLADGDRIKIGDASLFFHSLQNVSLDSSFVPAVGAAKRDIVLDAMKNELLTTETGDRDVSSLRRAKADLAAVYRAGQTISSILSTTELYNQIFAIVFEALPGVDLCSIHVLEEGTGALLCQGSRHRRKGPLSEQNIFSRGALNLALEQMKAVLSFDAQTDTRFDASESVAKWNIHSVMCVPLRSHNRLIGAIQACSLRTDDSFVVSDLKLLTAIGAQAGTALENAMLYEQLVAEKAQLVRANEELRLARENLVRSEKLAAIGQLTAGIAHDIKNPVFIMKGHAQLALSLLKGEEQEIVNGVDIKKGLEEIEKGAAHCGDIISQMLQFARCQAPSKEATSVNELVEKTLSFIGHEFKKRRVTIKIALSPFNPIARLDVNQIKQTLINIFLNALQAMKEGHGVMWVETDIAEDETGNRYARVMIQDNGHGMTEEVRKNIFDPFFTTKKAGDGLGGSGLGLSVSYGIIENHGGTIEVESEPGKGALFRIILPAEKI